MYCFFFVVVFFFFFFVVVFIGNNDRSKKHITVINKLQVAVRPNVSYCRMPARQSLQRTARAATRHGAGDPLVCNHLL